jgi:glucose-6-phosphate isomerase
MSNPLSLNTNFLYSNSSHHYGITQQTIAQTKSTILNAIAIVEQKITDQTYGFIQTLNRAEYITQCEEVLNQLTWAKNLVVIGIGGSDLGGRAIQQALQTATPRFNLLFHGDSTDPIAIHRLLKHLKLEETIFNIVSKSGETIETISQYIFFKSLLQKQMSQNWSKHFVFTTDKHKGILRQEANANNILTVPIPDDVGGRFSVLTPVGMLPALAIDIDIRQMIEGAQYPIKSENTRKVAQEIATTQYQLYTQGIKLAVLTPYSIQLEEFARWYRQLWAESLGKDGKGILPIQARGPADQHSQYQFYNQGSPIASYWHLQIDHRATDYTIDDTDIADGKYLIGHSFHEIINIEQQASALALNKNGRPVATIHLSELTPYTMGTLFMTFQLSVVYLAAMLGVNAFDQPGVEEGKQYMYTLLQKP